MLRSVVATALLLVVPFSALAEEPQTDLEEFFRGYINSWKADMDFEKLVAEFWNPQATFFPGRRVIQLGSRDAIAAALSAATQTSAASGFVGTKMTSFSSCRIREDLALVGIEYQGERTDGLEPPASAVYVAEQRSGRWWILAVMGSDTGAVRC